MVCAASHSHSNLANLPAAGASDVPHLLIGQEYIGTQVSGLRVSFQSSSSCRNLAQVSVVSDKNEKINIFWISLGGKDGTYYSNLNYPAEAFDVVNKPCSSMQQVLARVIFY